MFKDENPNQIAKTSRNDKIGSLGKQDAGSGKP
jgi:hypothetical protein